MTVPSAPPILAIETSCDDTAAAVWAGGRLASSVVAGQRVREAFGGVVPEVVSCAHEPLVVPITEAALGEPVTTQGAGGLVTTAMGPA